MLTSKLTHIHSCHWHHFLCLESPNPEVGALKYQLVSCWYFRLRLPWWLSVNQQYSSLSSVVSLAWKFIVGPDYSLWSLVTMSPQIPSSLHAALKRCSSNRVPRTFDSPSSCTVWPHKKCISSNSYRSYKTLPVVQTFHKCLHCLRIKLASSVQAEEKERGERRQKGGEDRQGQASWKMCTISVVVRESDWVCLCMCVSQCSCSLSLLDEIWGRSAPVRFRVGKVRDGVSAASGEPLIEMRISAFCYGLLHTYTHKHICTH